MLFRAEEILFLKSISIDFTFEELLSIIGLLLSIIEDSELLNFFRIRGPKIAASAILATQAIGTITDFESKFFSVDSFGLIACALCVKKEISPEVFYKNLIDGNFRVSLHTHSNFSDGKASVEEFLECARKYADKVAKLNKNDGLPPFTIALTDHDSVDGCAKIIEIIAKDPEKYKNLKFVSGCEFSVNNNGMHHDLTGLALNPFDENLINFLENIRTARRKTIDEFLAKGKKIEGKTITREQLSNAEKEAYAKKGKGIKNSIDNGSGVVSVRHAIKYYYKLLGEKPNHDIMRELGHIDTAKIEDVVKIVSDNGGYTSLTHPLKSFWKYIGDDGLLKLKNLGVSGIEVNHQYSPSKIEEIGSKNGSAANADTIFSNLTEKYKNFAEKNEMFLSGGTDCHEKQIFSREPKITDDFLNNQILK